MDKVSQHPVVDSSSYVLALGGTSGVRYDTKSVVEKLGKGELVVGRREREKVTDGGVNRGVIIGVVEEELNRRVVSWSRGTTKEERGEKVFRKSKLWG